MALKFADRLTALVEERRSQVCLGLDPDPAKLLPGIAVEADGDASPAVLAGRAVAAHCRELIERVGPALRRGEAAAGLLRTPRPARLGGARRGPRGRPRGGPDLPRRRQARRRAGHRRRLRAGAGRLDPDPLGRGPRARRRRLHRQPAARPRRARAAGRRLRGGRGGDLRPRPHQQSRRRRPDGRARARRRRCTSGSRRWSTSWRRACSARAGSAASARSSARPSPSTSPACAS